MELTWPELATPGGSTVAVLAAVAFAALAWGGLRQLQDQPPLRRWVLGALRVVTAIAAWCVLAQPRWSVTQEERVEGSLAVLFDVSRSMTVAREGETRGDEAAGLIARWASTAQDEGVAAYRFGTTLRAERWDEPAAELRDDETRLSPALEELLDGDEGVGGIVVVSDGAESSEVDLTRLREVGAKVHAVALGGDRDIRDDAIAEVQADALGFLRQPAEVRLVLRSLGGGAVTVPLTLREGERVVREQMVEIPEDGEVEVTLGFTPRRLGRAVYRVSIPVAEGDAVPANNERAFLVRVTRDKLRVLLVAGQPSWDVRFLRDFLKRDPSIDLISFFILRTTSDMTMASPDELALIPFPTDELFREHLGSFDVVLFQNFDYGPYQMAPYLPRIRSYVKRGGSFAMVGGDRSFASGGYADTPLHEILPVSLPPARTAPSRLVSGGRFRPRVVAELARHPVIELLPDPAANLGTWSNLAPLEGVNVVERAREGSQVLLEHPERRTASGRALPVLVLGSADEGRVLALTTDTSWRWGLTTGGLTGDASAYERFWDRALRWLARDPALEPARITSDRERYGPNGRIGIDAHLRDERYQPMGGEVELAILDASGSAIDVREARLDGEGRVSVEMEGPPNPGAYRVVARRVGDPEALCEEGFVVEAGGDELADPRPDPEHLQQITEATGGTFVSSAADAPDLDAFDTVRTRSLGAVTYAPLATAWAFVVVVALLLLEWALRRRWGMR